MVVVVVVMVTTVTLVFCFRPKLKFELETWTKLNNWPKLVDHGRGPLPNKDRKFFQAA